MVRSNRQAAAILREHGAHAATDVTGFGLIGHLVEMVRASDVDVTLAPDRVPLLPGARAAAEAGVRTGGAERNDEYLAPIVDWGRATPPERALLVDPQTSGGLLVAVPEDKLADYLSSVPGAVEIGDVLPRREASVVLV